MRLGYNKQSYCLKIYFLEVHMGNNAIVGQSGGPTSVINASLAGVFQASVMRGANRVYGMLNGVAGLLDERVTDLTATLGSSLEIELLGLAGTAAAWYWFMRRRGLVRPAAAVGGWVTGFAPAMVSHANGHPNFEYCTIAE